MNTDVAELKPQSQGRARGIHCRIDTANHPHQPNGIRTGTKPMTNLEKIQAFFAAYAAKDVAAVAAVMAEDIVWKIPGHHPLSGEKKGIPEVLAFFDELARANFKAEPLVIAEQGDYVIDHHRGWSDAGEGLD
jgi:ketosteroid isomerase-like protein